MIWLAARPQGYKDGRAAPTGYPAADQRKQLYAPQKEQRNRTSDMIGTDTDMPLPAGEENHCTGAHPKAVLWGRGRTRPVVQALLWEQRSLHRYPASGGTRPQYRVYLPGYPIAEFPGQQTAALFHVEKEES